MIDGDYEKFVVANLIIYRIECDVYIIWSEILLKMSENFLEVMTEKYRIAEWIFHLNSEWIEPHWK